MTADLRRSKALLGDIWDVGVLAARKPAPAVETSGALEEIARRISENYAEWEQSCAQLKPARRAPATHARKPESTGAPTSALAVEELPMDKVLAVQRAHAVEYANCRMRIALLESRLAGASPTERAVLERKLEPVRAMLAALEAVCRDEAAAEVHALAEAQPSRPLEPDAVLAEAEPVRRAAGIGASIVGGGHPAAGPQRPLVSGAMPPAAGERSDRVFAAEKCREEINDTRDSIDRAIRQPQ